LDLPPENDLGLLGDPPGPSIPLDEERVLRNIDGGELRLVVSHVIAKICVPEQQWALSINLLLFLYFRATPAADSSGIILPTGVGKAD